MRDFIIKSEKKILLILLTIIIFISDDTLLFGTIANSDFLLFKYFTYVILLLFLVNKRALYIDSPNSSLGLFLKLFAIFLFIVPIFHFHFTGGYIYNFLILIIAYCVVTIYPKKLIADYYLKIIYFISVCALVAIPLKYLIPYFFTFFPVIENSNGAVYYNLFVNVVSADPSNIRISSIFREPGVYMIYLNVAILIELLLNNKSLLDKRVVVLILSLLLTMSTAGYICFSLVIIVYLLNTKSSKGSNYKLISLVLFLTGLIYIIFNENLFNTIFGKLNSNSEEQGSSLARIASITVNYEIFKENIFFGVGLSSFPDKFEYYSYMLYNIFLDIGHNTNTILSLLAIYGVGYTSVYIWAMIKFSESFSTKWLVRFLIFILLILFYSNEDLRFSLFNYLLLFWGIKKFKFDKNHE